MKLHWSPRSPFVRKVVILLQETGQQDKVDYVRSVAALAEPNAALMLDNPLSQIPALVLSSGEVLYDSPVICEYLDTLHQGPSFFPKDGAVRWLALRRQALGDGMLSILLLWRQERMKTAQQQLPSWLAAFETKMNASLDRLEQEATALADGHFDIGHVTIGCTLSYLDYRFADIDWRAARPQLAVWHQEFCRRPSVMATMPDDASA
ncbi:glutathione S-transferase family protein [Glaciimonas sp. PCH181]|uniref:glutathione S-transferase family protein n=1 Tax=Glaciimonas sp. PCH181 TaxID=2133943 RepID=UPI000D3CDC7E|nr:glutathione S-transferase N-terminal domain-containing protein [Glaciimonas sp. PCH181]PUA16335.1 glutathione S-transferase [Glaciimonas sp. PCH181]